MVLAVLKVLEVLAVLLKVLEVLDVLKVLDVLLVFCSWLRPDLALAPLYRVRRLQLPDEY